MTPIETLTQLCEAREKATPGEWIVVACTDGGTFRCINAGPRYVHRDKGIVLEANDGNFIALAGSTDFPALLEHVKSLEAIVNAATAFIDSHVADPDITPLMRENYLKYLDAKAAAQAAKETHDNPQSPRPIATPHDPG